MNKTALISLLAALLAGSAFAQTKVLYENDFEQAAVDKLPDEMMLIEGGFAVKAEAGNQFLELPGAPLDTYGVIFGPTESSNLVITARIFSTNKGRRYPTFAVGLNGIGGYKLQVAPGREKLELIKGDTVQQAIPNQWKSGVWTHLKLQIRKISAGEYKIEGKVWNAGEAEPKDWAITMNEKELPPPGRASIWGSPFASTPIRYDDIKVLPLTGQ
jgi:hypothetical protein